jgi:pimeloyl-ACP methyl ester carboxylesterase
MSGWSWLYNVEVLNPQYRTYAIDTIGEVGKSELNNPSRYPANGKEYADLYAEIADILRVEKSHVLGASMGGYIATNYAIFYPERVEKLALLGPMGMTPETMKTAVRIMGAQFFPLGPIQKNTARWALGDDPYVQEQAGEWFQIVLTKTAPKEARPVTFTKEQLESMQVPVLLVIGTKDALTGDPEAVKELAKHTPEIQIEVLESGHLIGVEQKKRVNELLPAFFSNDE